MFINLLLKEIKVIKVKNAANRVFIKIKIIIIYDNDNVVLLGVGLASKILYIILLLSDIIYYLIFNLYLFLNKIALKIFKSINNI